MKIVWNILLGLGAVACAGLVLLQGFGLPALTNTQTVLLCISGAFCLQWLFLRISQKVIVQAIPAIIAACWACWGYFLYLTSPAWRNATFHDFLTDYACYLGGCLLICALSWLLPRLIPRIRKAIRRKLRKRKIAREHKMK